MEEINQEKREEKEARSPGGETEERLFNLEEKMKGKEIKTKRESRTKNAEEEKVNKNVSKEKNTVS